MNFISVSCQHCGAPLEVPAEVTHLTCGHCDTTVMLSPAREATQPTLPKQGEKSPGEKDRVRKELKELDQQWNDEQEQRQQEIAWSPFLSYEVAGLVLMVAVVAGFMVGVTTHFLFGLLVFALLLVQAAYICAFAEEYESKKFIYRKQREALLRKLNEG